MSYNSSKIFDKGAVAAVVAISSVLVLCAYFMTVVIMPAQAKWVSGINVVLFAAPAFWACRRWLGLRDAIHLFVILGGYALTVETFALATGYPYGEFYYSDLLGYKLFGLTPFTVSLAWTPLVIGAYAIAGRVASSSRVMRVIFATIILIGFDLVVDPGAVRVGFWRYEGGGAYYGVPWSNYAGWVVTGFAAMCMVEAFLYWRRPLLPAPAQAVLSAFFITVLWTSVALFAGLWSPVLFGVVIIAGLAWFYVRYHYAFDDMVVYVSDDGRPVGTSSKLEAHNDDTQLHSAFSVFLFNDRGELLLQQRAFSKRTWPGTWSNSCCGHVMLHENVLDAAKRRIRYELGTKAIDLKILLPDYRYRAEKDGVVENEICPVLVGMVSRPLEPNPQEVAEVRWVDWDDFLSEIRDPHNGYSPWAVEETTLLAALPEFNRMRQHFVVESSVRNGE